MPKDRVIFRMIRGGVVAFMPDVEANRGMIMSYEHQGQHGEASKDFYREGRLATPAEYHDLKMELERAGYNVKVCKRL
jgi:hypothetical protein